MTKVIGRSCNKELTGINSGIIMEDFPEAVRRAVKEKASFRCCRCQNIGVEVHHIISQKDGGANDLDNAAPLCAKCHDDFGDNPAKRKEIKHMRDWWYEKCEEIYKTALIVLEERPKPRELKSEFPVVFFCNQNTGELHWDWPNDFLHYYQSAEFALKEMAKIDPNLYSKIIDADACIDVFLHLIERLVFVTVSQCYGLAWLFERSRWQFPWGTEVRRRVVDTSEIRSDSIKYLDINGFKDNMFARVSEMDLGAFMVPKGTTVNIDRGSMAPTASIVMENDYYRIQITVFFRGWHFGTYLPDWLSGLTKKQQDQIRRFMYSIIFDAGPKKTKRYNDPAMGLYQKWAEDLLTALSEQFDWLVTLNNVKEKLREQKIFDIWDYLRHLKKGT